VPYMPNDLNCCLGSVGLSATNRTLRRFFRLEQVRFGAWPLKMPNTATN